MNRIFEEPGWISKEDGIRWLRQDQMIENKMSHIPFKSIMFDKAVPFHDAPKKSSSKSGTFSEDSTLFCKEWRFYQLLFLPFYVPAKVWDGENWNGHRTLLVHCKSWVWDGDLLLARPFLKIWNVSYELSVSQKGLIEQSNFAFALHGHSMTIS